MADVSRAERALVLNVATIAAASAIPLAPNQVIAAVSVEFDPEISARQVETAIADLERRVRAAQTEVQALFVKPQTAAAFGEGRARRRG